jgi:hypothetical protein
VDFDFFSERPALHGPSLADRLRETFSTLQVTNATEGTFNGLINDVKLSFFRYPYPLVEPPYHWEAHDLHVAGLPDLGAMKLSAIAQRGLKKDFIDVHALMNQGITLGEMLDFYRRKYSTSDVMRVRVGLAYFDSAEDQLMPRMLTPVEWTTIKADILRAAKELK